MVTHRLTARIMAATLGLGFGLAVSGGAQAPKEKKVMDEKKTWADHDQLISGWPKASQEAFRATKAKYGAPLHVSEHLALWGKAGPWKRTIIYGYEVPHDFPMPHTDVMQQWVDYRVPLDQFEELAEYDGSVVVERTNGEISARCDKEAANFLALNLAHDIITGKRSADAARKMYAEEITKLKAGQTTSYTTGLMFGMMSATRDPDKP